MVNLSNDIITVLENLRKNIDHEFKKMFEEAQVIIRYLILMLMSLIISMKINNFKLLLEIG